jgi:tRNA(Arg) A34 adenosine deaminase TadA
MCLSAIIWANIKTIYYANNKEDAAEIGFRDELIYDYLEKLTNGVKDEQILKLTSMKREEAIKVFEEWKQKSDKIEY